MVTQGMPTGAAYPRLVGDVGGTGIRFGWVEGPTSGVERLATYGDAEPSGLEAAIVRYLAQSGSGAPRSCAIGVAGPVSGDAVALTNRPWTFSTRALQQRLGLEQLLVLNDFAALAFALPTLTSTEVRRIGGGEAVSAAPLALLGPGTGLGVSALLATRTGRVPVVGEGGHVSLSAGNAHEESVVAVLRDRFGHVSAERALSGPGIVNLYEAVCQLGGHRVELLAATRITERALRGEDPRCRQAVDLFFAFLGSVAGDLALTIGARGGVYVAGGIVARLGDSIADSSFRERFEAKGRLQAYLARIPTSLILDSSGLALRGANAALDAHPA